MAKKKYGKLIVEAPIGKERIGEVAHLFGGKHFDGANFSIAWVGINKPLFMMKESHAHDCEQFLVFIGGDPGDAKEFGAEIELCLGEEEEKHIIKAPAVVHIPAWLKHCPLNFKKVEKPIIFMDINLSPEYERK